MLLIPPFLLFFCFSLGSSAPCNDGKYCNEILRNRFPQVSTAGKCTMWVLLFGPDLFPEELNKVEANRVMTFSYCPVSCASACNSITSKPILTTKSSTTTTTTTSSPPTTTKSAEEKLTKILENDQTFGDLLSEFGELSTEEGLRRYALYTTKKTVVDSHNRLFAAGLTSYKMGLNVYSLKESFEIATNSLEVPTVSVGKIVLGETRRKKRESENSVDWSSFMKPVRDQQKCGGCWAFAMTAVVEGVLAIRGRNLTARSVQQLLDCDHSVSSVYGVGNRGCAGGYLTVAVDYLAVSGLHSFSSYPFTGSSSSKCHLSPKTPQIHHFDSGFISIDGNVSISQLEQAMEDRLRKGPVATGFATSDEIYGYESGIFDGPCGKSINHAVVIVGFTKDYWIVRNSWGEKWGEGGYFRIRREYGKDPCKMLSYWATAAPDMTIPGQNNEMPPGGYDDYEDDEDHGEKENEKEEKDFCDGENCDSCGCEDDEDDEEFIPFEYVWRKRS